MDIYVEHRVVDDGNVEEEGGVNVNIEDDCVVNYEVNINIEDDVNGYDDGVVNFKDGVNDDGVGGVNDEGVVNVEEDKHEDSDDSDDSDFEANGIRFYDSEDERALELDDEFK
ncbi:unnamed protein product [Vicia faba]|uniref:Uncharacterized protein n=1 Tax=Vicia faba TaxID=3906 RepID=A0AAV1B2J4_VICFA|nr:unnamed protein product [Vicia faba]